MMYIKKGELCIPLHIDEDFPPTYKDTLVKGNPSDLSVQADCDELRYITENFQNLPMHPGHQVVTWFGEHARFIVANL